MFPGEPIDIPWWWPSVVVGWVFVLPPLVTVTIGAVSGWLLPGVSWRLGIKLGFPVGGANIILGITGVLQRRSLGIGGADPVLISHALGVALGCAFLVLLLAGIGLFRIWRSR